MTTPEAGSPLRQRMIDWAAKKEIAGDLDPLDASGRAREPLAVQPCKICLPLAKETQELVDDLVLLNLRRRGVIIRHSLGRSAQSMVDQNFPLSLGLKFPLKGFVPPLNSLSFNFTPILALGLRLFRLKPC